MTYILNINWISIFGLFLFSIFFNKNQNSDNNILKNITSNVLVNSCSSINSYSQKRKDTTAPSVKLNLAKAKKIEILVFKKGEFKPDSNDKADIKCKDWSITSKQFMKVIREFKQISSEQQHLLYSYFPCRMTGEIRIDKKVFEFWLNAGSTLTLRNNNITLYFSCSNKKCTKLFLAGKI